jgi:hypothetical protein
MKATEFIKEESGMTCPPATQDITLNLKNRQKAIDEYGYGPLNPDLPNTKFWMAKVDEWNLDSVDEAKSSLCGNCAAFDQRKETLDCIAQGIGSDTGAEDPTIEAGDLGYCRFLKFKCASRRTCDAWVTGGPLTDKDPVDENLHDWFGKEKWVRMDTKGNIKGDCAREPGEGKPKCLPQAKAHALGKAGRASAAQKKRREDPNPDRRGPAHNVATKVREADMAEGEVVAFRRPAQSQQSLPKDILHLANEWFHANDDTNTLQAVTDQGYGQGADNLVKYIQAKLQSKGWTIDFDDEIENIVLTNRSGQTVALPVDDAYNETGWAKQDQLDEKWSAKYKKSINCAHPKGFSQRAHCAGKRKHNESVEQEMTCPDCGRCETHGDPTRDTIDEACWKGYHKEGMKKMFGKTVPNCVKNEAVEEGSEAFRNKVRSALWYEWQQDPNYRDEDGKPYEQTPEQMDQDDYDMFEEAVDEIVQYANEMGIANAAMAVAKYNMLISDVVQRDLGGSKGLAEQLCPECGGDMYPDTMINEKQDACYYKVKSRYKVWPSAYASGALVQCRKKGAANWGNKSKNESQENVMDELSRIVELGTGLSLEDRAELAEEFDLIETIIEDIAEHNGVDAEMIWEDLESLTDDELYVFATTTTIMETEAWQKANNRDRTDGMSRKAVKAYRREHPGSKLKTAVTTKPSKLKKGSKASKRRKSYCSRSRGQMKMHNISCAKTPDKAICKARRRWNC